MATDKGTNHTLLTNLLVEQELKLKVGAQVMLVKNLNDEVSNKTMGRVVGFYSHTQVKFHKTLDDNNELKEAISGDKAPNPSFFSPKPKKQSSSSSSTLNYQHIDLSSVDTTSGALPMSKTNVNRYTLVVFKHPGAKDGEYIDKHWVQNNIIHVALFKLYVEIILNFACF
ncbi:hypothetical protein PM082_019223 [Marasmius tenuissimus]|nr:hypothetical protein PM082_019223 [Marasmius tenuissimus]